jgi:hypothetical protein
MQKSIHLKKIEMFQRSIYTIKKGDSLETIAKSIGISKEELKRFHNTYCSLENLIGQDLSNQTQVIVPNLDSIKNSINSRKEISKIPIGIRLHKDFFASTYQVKEKIWKKNQPETSLEYQIDLDYVSPQENEHIVHFKKSNIKKNRRLCNDKISNLSIQTFESLFPLPVLLKSSGNFIEILDYKLNVSDKFKVKRKDLAEVFTGPIEKMYLDKMEESLKNQTFAEHQLKSSLLFQTLFFDFGKLKSTNPWKSHICAKQGMFNIPFEFLAPSVQEENNSITYSVTANSLEKISERELVKKKKLEAEFANVSIHLNFHFKFQPKTLKLLFAEGEINFYNQNINIEKQHITFTA